MINLLGNAINYTDKGSVCLTVFLVTPPPKAADRTDLPIKTPGAWIRFETKDTGMGIDPRDMEIIFNRFARARYGRQEGDGTGLGLPISRHFVGVMGGELTAESEPGRGAVFFFDLPVKIATPREIKASVPRRLPLGLVPGLPPCSVLIAEDHEPSRIFLAKLLEKVGFKVYTAENGRQAVDQFFCLKPDLVFMDIRMPVMDGLTAVKKIKAGQKEPQIPVIAITAHAFEKERIQILSAGFDDFIPKPLDEATLFECMIQHLGVAFTYKADVDKVLCVPHFSLGGLDADRVKGLAGNLKAALKNAAAELNQEQTLACIEKIKQTDKSMAAHLAVLANEFKFEQILAVMQEPRNEKA
jgi:CheY-like chemotaxis protein